MKHARELSVCLVLALILAVLAVFAPAFYSPQSLLSRCAEQAPSLILVIGMTLVILIREIDISIGSQFGVCAVVAGTASAAGFSLPLAFALAILSGAIMGALNGALVAGLRLPSIVVTLGTMVTWAETLRLWQQGRFIDLPRGAQWFGLDQSAGQWALILASLALLALAVVSLSQFAIGRQLYAVGSNAEAGRLAGINPRRITFSTFALMGAMAGAAAALNMMRSPQVDPKSGNGLELKAIAAAVVGGVAISGGRGAVWGAALGLLLLAVINPALTYLHVEAYWERATEGLIILAAVLIDGLPSRRHLA